jgi:hypothetical protein
VTSRQRIVGERVIECRTIELDQSETAPLVVTMAGLAGTVARRRELAVES